MDSQETRFRDKITFMQFLLSIGIIYQHTQWNYRENEILNFAQSFLFYLLETCVPFFFMISGYLFYRTLKIQNVKSKILSRGKTLLVPYVIWNTIYAIFIVSLANLGVIHNITISEHWGVLLQLVNSEFSPLWFVKYLIIFTLISPLMYYLLKRKILGAIIILIMVGGNAWSYYSGIMQIPIDVNANNWVMFNYQYIFYAVGAYGALNWKSIIEKPNSRKTYLAISVLFMLIVIYFLLLKNYTDAILNHSFRLIYICAIWFVFDIKRKFNIRKWMGNSFFLYCSHLIILQCFQKICDILIGKIGAFQSILYIMEYIFLPVLLIGFLLFFAEALKRKLPKIWDVLTGSRGREKLV